MIGSDPVLDFSRMQRLASQPTMRRVSRHENQAIKQLAKVLRVLGRIERELDQFPVSQGRPDQRQSQHVRDVMILKLLPSEIVVRFPALDAFLDHRNKTTEPRFNP